MRQSNAWWVGLAILMAAPSAWAQVEQTSTEGVGSTPELSSGGGGRYPVAYAHRPLTLHAGMLALDGEFAVLHLNASPGAVVSVSGSTATLLRLGASFGVTDDIEIGATVLPLQLSPDFKYGNPLLYALFRFTRGNVEIGAQAMVSIPVESGSKTGLVLRIPVLLRAGSAVRIDTGAGVRLGFSDPLQKSLEIPFQLSLDLTNQFYVYLTSGWIVPDFEPKRSFLPLAIGAAYTIAGNRGAVADFGPAFAFPFFLYPDSPGDKVITQLWILTFNARIFLHLL